MTADNNTPLTCNYCRRPIPEEKNVRLWDGKDYCEDCVDGKLPGLAEYAREHPTLEERLPFSLTLMVLRLLPVLVAAGVCFFFLCPEEWPSGPLKFALGMEVMCAFVLGMICLAAALERKTVSLENGQLTVPLYPQKFTFFRQTGPVQVPLGKEMVWDARKQLVANPTLALGVKPMRNKIVSILSKRTRPFRWNRSHQFYFELTICKCGWTPETRKLWEAFLELAGIPPASKNSSEDME